MGKRIADLAPADLKIAQATLPEGVNYIPQTQRNDNRSRANGIKYSSCQDQTETSKYVDITNLAGFQLKIGRFVVQGVLFQVKTQPVFVESM